METYLLVARGWTKWSSKRRMTRALQQMVVSAETVLASNWATEQSDYVYSVTIMDARGCPPRVPNKPEADHRGFVAATHGQHENMSLVAHDIEKYAFAERATLANGKIISFDAKIIEEPFEVRKTLTCEGLEIARGNIYSMLNFTVGNTLYFSIKEDEEFTSYVVNLEVKDLHDPAAKPNQIVKGSMPIFRVERKTGALWWSTQDSIIREGATMLTIPSINQSKIASFEVTKNHYLVQLVFEMGFAARDQPDWSYAFAVYHKKWGARLLYYPNRNKDELITVCLTSNRLLLYSFDGTLVRFWLLSGRRISASVLLPLDKFGDTEDKKIFAVACVAEKQIVSLYLKW